MASVLFDVFVGYHYLFSPTFCPLLKCSAELASISLSIVFSRELCSIPLSCVSFTYCAKGHGVRCCERFVFSFTALSYGLTLSPGFLLCLR